MSIVHRVFEEWSRRFVSKALWWRNRFGLIQHLSSSSFPFNSNADGAGNCCANNVLRGVFGEKDPSQIPKVLKQKWSPGPVYSERSQETGVRQAKKSRIPDHTHMFQHSQSDSGESNVEFPTRTKSPSGTFTAAVTVLALGPMADELSSGGGGYPLIWVFHFLGQCPSLGIKVN